MADLITPFLRRKVLRMCQKSGKNGEKTGKMGSFLQEDVV